MAITPREALERLLPRISVVESEWTDPLDPSASGRVLAEAIRLDRDSPACDVSAMDGYAVRHSELTGGSLPVLGDCPIGESPREVPGGAALRIFTGSPLPHGADTVVRLEAVDARADAIRLNGARDVRPGDDIRRRGENAKAGAPVLEAGAQLNPAAMGAMATVGPARVAVHRRLRVAVVTTGNELVTAPPADGAPLDPWRLRDSNGPALRAMLSQPAWIEAAEWSHAADSLEELTRCVCDAVASHDAVVLTGGVSKGDHDHVPAAVQAAGAEVVFHRVRARPGQPTLGAVANGKPVIGLPGNPLSVLCAGRRLLAPALRARAGLAHVEPHAPAVAIDEWFGKPAPLTWWRPVRLTSPGWAAFSRLMGSGDVIGPADSDGFVEVPPDSSGAGSYLFYPWSI